MLRRTTVLGLALGALVLAGCGSAKATPAAISGGSGTTSSANTPAIASSALASIDATLTRDEAEPVFSPPGPSIDISGLKGKTVFVIPQTANPFVQGITASMQKIAKQTGIHLIVYPNQGLVSQWEQGMEEAIAQKVDLIDLSAAPDPRELQPQLAAAKAAGIPVLVTHFYDDSDPAPPACTGCAAGVSAIVPAPFNRAGADEADWIIRKTNAKAHVLIIGATEDIVSQGIEATMKGQYAKYCASTCTTQLISIPPSEWGTLVESEVATALTADPKINVVDCLFDAMVPGAVQAITTLGRQIPVVSFNGSTSALKYIQDNDVVAMDVGESVDWIGYASMDQAFRLLLKLPAGHETLPIRIWDATNVSGAGSPPNLLDGYGSSYVAGFDKLWGLSG